MGRNSSGQRDNPNGHEHDDAQVELEGRATGFVKRLAKDKGFGFIRDEAGKEFFFHRSSLTAGSERFETLSEGDKVTYTPGRSEKGPRAQDVIVNED